MSFFDRLFGQSRGRPAPAAQAPADAGGRVFRGLDDPALLEYMRSGSMGQARAALFNTTAFRCVEIISGCIGALPFRPMRMNAAGTLTEDRDHPLYEVLNDQANAYQTGSEFRQMMQARALVDGNAHARIVRSVGRVIGLLPLDGVTQRLRNGEPVYTGPNGDIPAADIFHLRGPSWDGINGLSRVRLAARAINLSREAEDTAIGIFHGGVSAGGALEAPDPLSDAAYGRLKKDMSEMMSGPGNAGAWFILEEGLKANPFQQTGRDSQLLERSKHQVEEIARMFGGVPRPLLCVDDTTWGSGVEQLGILFVRFTLLPWFTAWERRGRMSLLTRAERRTWTLDFDEQELLRGSMKDLSEFLAKVVGGNGNNSIATQNEGRAFLGLPPHETGDRLAFTSGDQKNVAA